MEELIKKALREAGLDEGLVGKIKVQKEDEIEGAVANLKTQLEGKKSFAEFIKENGYENDLAAMIQSETDKRVTQAIKTYEEKLKKEKLAAQKSKKKDEVNENLTEDQKTIKALQESVNSLTQIVTGQVDASKKGELRTKAAKAIKDAGLPEKWIDRVNVESEEEIEGVVKELETEYTELKQSIVNGQLDENGVPKSGDSSNVTNTVIDKFADSLKDQKSKIPVAKLD